MLIDLSGPQPFWPVEATRLWQDCLHRAGGVESLLRTAPLAGDEPLREEIGREFGLDARLITVVSGVRAAALCYGRCHRHITLERPTFLGVVPILTAHGAVLAHASWEEITAGASDPSGLLWLTSPCRNPDGATLTPEQREALEAMARAGRRIIVNGTYVWFHSAFPPVRGADLVVSFHKLAGVGGRLGFVYGERFAEEAVPELTASSPPATWQRSWALFLRQGGLEPLRAANVTAVERAAELFGAGLPGLAVKGPSVLIPVPAPLSEDEFVRELAEEGFKVLQGRHFAAPWPAIRVNFAAARPAEAARFTETLLRRLPASGWSPPR
ncbi:MAG TPA: aminotransferase class I/II-fold pyridoxal phosphate-dependent enzyme [Streptosporangiaceae bacterium]|jgi:DNA-binding transcriptional MocR family regulator